MSWTDEKVNKLKELWGKGNTASQIAEIIGGISRNAAIGKAHRLNLSAKIKTRTATSNESFENALRAFSPDAVCLKDTKEQEVAEVLINVGYKEIGNDGFCRIWVG